VRYRLRLFRVESGNGENLSSVLPGKKGEHLKLNELVWFDFENFEQDRSRWCTFHVGTSIYSINRLVRTY
jgi:hypothetical protein